MEQPPGTGSINVADGNQMNPMMIIECITTLWCLHPILLPRVALLFERLECFWQIVHCSGTVDAQIQLEISNYDVQPCFYLY